MKRRTLDGIMFTPISNYYHAKKDSLNHTTTPLFEVPVDNVSKKINSDLLSLYYFFST